VVSDPTRRNLRRLARSDRGAQASAAVVRRDVSEEALLLLFARYPHRVAIARRVEASLLHLGLRRLRDRCLVAPRGDLYALTKRGRSELKFNQALRQIERASLGAS